METIRYVEKSSTLNHTQMRGEKVLRPCYDFWTLTNHSTDFSCNPYLQFPVPYLGVPLHSVHGVRPSPDYVVWMSGFLLADQNLVGAHIYITSWPTPRGSIPLTPALSLSPLQLTLMLPPPPQAKHGLFINRTTNTCHDKIICLCKRTIMDPGKD